MRQTPTRPGWDDLYRSTDPESMPWFYPHLDPDLETELTRRQVSGGLFLDLGTGPGTQAIALAKRGFCVVATDISAAAIEKALLRAEREGASVDFRRDDVLDSRLDLEFEYVFDRGCFHVLPIESRPLYVETLDRLLRPEGLLFLKCFSRRQPGTTGPHRISSAEIRKDFEPRLEVLSIVETSFPGELSPPPKALFCVIRSKRIA